MTRRNVVAVLGGTFDHLHRGHHALLRAAFAVGDSVAIGLTTERYLERHPKAFRSRLEPFTTRRRHLLAWLRNEFPGRRYSVVALEEPFGGSVGPGVDVLVASAESRGGAERVNEERFRRGLPPVRLLFVPVAWADDLLPVSSTRIRAGQIDREGRCRPTLTIGIAGPLSPPDRLELRNALRSTLPGHPSVRLQPMKGPTGSRRPPDRFLFQFEASRAQSRLGRVRLSDLSGPVGRVRSFLRGEAGSLERAVRGLLHARLTEWQAQHHRPD